MKKALLSVLLCAICAAPAMSAIEQCGDIAATLALNAGDQQRFVSSSWDKAWISGTFTAAGTPLGASVRMGLYHSADGTNWYPLHTAAGDSTFAIAYSTGANKFQYRLSQDYYSTTSGNPLPTPDLCIGRLKIVLTNTSGGTNTVLSAIKVYVVHD